MLRHALPVLLMMSVLAPAAATPPAESKVVKLRRAQVMTFAPDGDRFRRVGPLAPGALALPARVLQASGRGYVLIEATPSPVWVEKMDVDIQPKLPLNAQCIAGVSTAADTTQGIVRGAGQGCP